MSKRILSLVLALVMVLGTFGTVFAEETGTGSEKIDWLVKQGIVQGTSQGLELDKTVDRATVARLVAVALNEEAAAESLKLVPSGFVDMNTAHWANGYAALANGRGYMVGNAKREFMPSKATTYAEVLSVLVRVSLGRDLTDAEKAGAITWYAPYVAKAAELGITEGVSVANVGADAVRKDVLEMLYNVLTNKSHGRYDVYKAIVLENSRVSKLSDNEIVVEVIDKVKTAQYVEESRKEGRGSQLTLKIDPEVIDNKEVTSENLLGRVADFTVTKDGKVVEVKIDESYKVETGKFTAERNTMVKGSARYSVNLPERYYADRDKERYDETIFRTYFNNRSYSYEDFYRGKAEDSDSREEKFVAEYARVTVKDGKVLLINAFGFDDIAPVKEVSKEGEVVIVYNDARDGATKRYEISSSANLIFVNDGVLSKGNRKDIAVDNVIHEYKGGFIVKQDKPVSGKFEKVSQDKYDDVYVHVDGKEYYVADTNLKRGVFNYETNKDFYTLTPDNAHNDLRTFRDETVKLVTALNGSVQYIGSEVDLGEFLGIATRIVGKDLRVLRSDKKTYDYEANLDTTVIADGSTGHKGLNSIEKHSLVFVRANDKALNRVRDFGRPGEKITKFDSVKKIETTSGEYKILDETEVFVINKDKNGEYVEVRKIKDVQDAWKDLTTGKDDVKVNVLSEDKYIKESLRSETGRQGSKNIAIALVFSDIEIPKDTTIIYAEYRGYSDRQGRELDVRTADSEPMTVKLASSVETGKLESGDILRLEQTKGDDKEIVGLKVVVRVNSKHDNYETYKVDTVTRYNEINLENGPTITKDRATKIFGNEPVAGDVIAFAEYESTDDDYDKNYAAVIKNFGSRGTVKNDGLKPVDEETKGVVSHIDADNFEVEIEDAKGKVVMYKVTGSARTLFGTNTFDGAKVGDEVKTKITDGRLVGLEIVKTKELLDNEKSVANALAKVKDLYKFAYGTTVDATEVEAKVVADINDASVTVEATKVSDDSYKVTLTKGTGTEKAEDSITVAVEVEAPSKDASVATVKVKGVTATKVSSGVYSVELPAGTTYGEIDIKVAPTHNEATVAIKTAGTDDATSDWIFTVTAEDTTVTENITVKVVVLP